MIFYKMFREAGTFLLMELAEYCFIFKQAFPLP